MTSVIEVSGLTKRYGGQAVVDGISFHVDQGEIFGILGPNGAGKTTAVECMEGLRRRDGGEVRILGLDPKTDGHRLHQRIGVQLQEAQLQDKLKVAEALELYASFYPDPADWRELLERWGLAAKAGTRFGKLSGGQKQRLFIALALVGNPEVVFLDELTAGLDPGARRATWELISKVRAGGVTVVLVSHFMDEVEELCDRVAILERGRIAALDTPAGLVDSAGGEFRMRFRPMAPLDEQSLGVLPGVTAVSRRGEQVTVTGTGDFPAAVTAELARRQVVAADLRIEGRSLDSAYVALTGRSMDARALHPEVEVTLLRVAQEALANVARHAGASRAGVTLSYMEDVVTLDVRDDGVGFTVPANGDGPAATGEAGGSPPQGGFGLIAMRQRVNRLAGQLEIESEPGAGTAVSASVPAIPLGPPSQAAQSAEPPQAAISGEEPS